MELKPLKPPCIPLKKNPTFCVCEDIFNYSNAASFIALSVEKGFVDIQGLISVYEFMQFCMVYFMRVFCEYGIVCVCACRFMDI